MSIRIKCAAVILVTLPLMSACTTSMRASEYAPHELGEVVRVEPATVLSQRYVNLKNWRGKSRGAWRYLGVSYVIKIDRTGETLSITQTNDVAIANGASAWVEFGDRIRLVPRS